MKNCAGILNDYTYGSIESHFEGSFPQVQST